ncbi:MAG: competence protein ComK [Bacillota bacterium]
MIILNEYLIVRETQLMYAVYDEYGNENTVVLEQYKKIKVLKPVKDILKDNCEYHGCTLEGKLDAAKGVLKGKRMLPLCLSITFRICLFPTHSADKSECMWISVNHIRQIIPYKGESFVILENYEEVQVPVSYDALTMKKAFASDLLYTYISNQEKFGNTIHFGRIIDLPDPTDPNSGMDQLH